MVSFGTENYVLTKYNNPTPAWMKAERLEYCDQTTEKKIHAYNLLTQILFSIFF